MLCIDKRLSFIGMSQPPTEPEISKTRLNLKSPNAKPPQCTAAPGARMKLNPTNHLNAEKSSNRFSDDEEITLALIPE
jgi:hypothetical protein